MFDVLIWIFIACGMVFMCWHSFAEAREYDDRELRDEVERTLQWNELPGGKND